MLKGSSIEEVKGQSQTVHQGAFYFKKCSREAGILASISSLLMLGRLATRSRFRVLSRTRFTSDRLTGGPCRAGASASTEEMQ